MSLSARMILAALGRFVALSLGLVKCVPLPGHMAPCRSGSTRISHGVQTCQIRPMMSQILLRTVATHDFSNAVTKPNPHGGVGPIQIGALVRLCSAYARALLSPPRSKLFFQSRRL